MAKLRGLSPVDPEGARILVLGSFPSLRSLEKGEYYGHERNHFWEVLGLVVGRQPPGDYPGRLAFLAGAGIAVWDLIAACERVGSLDQDIRAQELNPVLGFLRARPALARVALNGGKAAAAFLTSVAPELGRPAGRSGGLAIGEIRIWEPPSLVGRRFLVARLPSTSPIPTRGYKSARDKASAWRTLLGSP